MNVLLIDDEPAVLRQMQRQLQRQHPEIQIVGIATNGRKGLQLLRAKRPDLLFLDVEMPEMNGFELLRHLAPEERPEIIFVTSKEEYAVQAFRVAALDYLVKPVSSRHLREVIDRARKQLSKPRENDQRINSFVHNQDTKDPDHKKVGIPSDTGVDFFAAHEIIYCRGEDGYTRINLTKGRSRLSAYSIGEYKKTLGNFNFCPVHRSYLVNYHHVVAYGRSGVLKLSDDTAIQVSRRRRPVVDAWLGKRFSLGRT